MIIIIIVIFCIFLILSAGPLTLYGLSPSLSQPEYGVCGPPIRT